MRIRTIPALVALVTLTAGCSLWEDEDPEPESPESFRIRALGSCLDRPPVAMPGPIAGAEARPGELRWVLPVRTCAMAASSPYLIEEEPWRSHGPGGLDVSAGAGLVVTREDGAVTAYDARDGGRLWREYLEHALPEDYEPDTWSVHISRRWVAVHINRLGADYGWEVVFDARTGERAWVSRFSGRHLALFDDRLIRVDDGRVTAVDPSSGTRQWRSGTLRVPESAVVAGEVLFADTVDRFGERPPAQRALQRVDLRTGELTRLVLSRPVEGALDGVADGVLILQHYPRPLETGRGVGEVVAVDSRSGRELWRIRGDVTVARGAVTNRDKHQGTEWLERYDPRTGTVLDRMRRGVAETMPAGDGWLRLLPDSREERVEFQQGQIEHRAIGGARTWVSPPLSLPVWAAHDATSAYVLTCDGYADVERMCKAVHLVAVATARHAGS